MDFNNYRNIAMISIEFIHKSTRVQCVTPWHVIRLRLTNPRTPMKPTIGFTSTSPASLSKTDALFGMYKLNTSYAQSDHPERLKHFEILYIKSGTGRLTADLQKHTLTG